MRQLGCKPLAQRRAMYMWLWETNEAQQEHNARMEAMKMQCN